jgi:glutamate dehydrogenase/leucine dehydrogenase
VEKLESTEGFLLFDLEGAERFAGVARLAPKVLQDSAEMLARSVTYSFATFGLPVSGMSAAINAKPDDRDAALAAFIDEVSPRVASGELTLRPSTGLTDADFRPLGVTNTDAALVARGGVAAAEAVLGGSLEGKTVGVYGSGLAADDARIGAVYRKARVLDSGPLDAPADVMFIAGKQGMIDHEIAATIKAEVVIPLSAVPVTSKAYAAFRRQGITYIPDFVSIAGPLLLEFDEAGGDPVERVRESVSEIAPEGPNAWLVAIGRAEAYLSTWQGAVPFDRPLAS